MSKIDEMKPSFRPRVVAVIADAAGKGVALGIEPTLGGRRNQEQQNKVLRGGHSQKKNSYHLTGEAADLYEISEDKMTGHKRYSWPSKRAQWIIGSSALAHGIGWGGNFFNNKWTRWYRKQRVKANIMALRKLGWPMESKLYDADIGWDAVHIQVEPNFA